MILFLVGESAFTEKSIGFSLPSLAPNLVMQIIVPISLSIRGFPQKKKLVTDFGLLRFNKVLLHVMVHSQL